jgi:uncharacterized protein (DUF433 family)
MNRRSKQVGSGREEGSWAESSSQGCPPKVAWESIHRDSHPESEIPMSVAETQYEHVILNGDDVPVIDGTSMKVIELVLGRMAYGWSPEELHFQHPYLTLGQIYSALAYYWDHKEELDRDIERRLEFVDQVRQTREPSPLVARLRARMSMV